MNEQTAQLRLRLSLPHNRFETSRLNDPDRDEIENGRRISATVIKERLRRAMRRVTVCQPATIQGHCEVLLEFKQLAHVAMDMGVMSPEENKRTDRQLAHPSTVADYVAAAELTLRHHRAPEGIPVPREELERIECKIDCLARTLGSQLSAICAALGLAPLEADKARREVVYAEYGGGL